MWNLYSIVILNIFLTAEFPEDDPVMKTLKEYEDRERRKRESLNKTLSCQNRNRDDDDHDDDDDSSEEEHENRFVGPILAPLHVRVKPLDEAEVRRNKLNVDEIKSIAKFSNYEPGKPNKVLIYNESQKHCKTTKTAANMHH